ncbi:unnamed protein product [Rotaria sordida]|uniref:SAM domain-containing protein n=1 Tax=Rotaria sordida TaxID=392033 RepID=A0A814FQV9_9BILA|nr:unnamed protein product [Rotaria sordida]
MAIWTVDQVGDWLKVNNFDKYIETFKNEDIDGIALVGLQDDDILKLLSIQDEDGTIRNPTMRTQRKFKVILEEYRKLIRQERKKRRRSSSSVNKELHTNINNYENNLLVIPSRNISHTTNDIGPYTKTYTIEPKGISMKFFKNELICSNLTKYILKKYNVKCYIPIECQYDTKVTLEIKLSGIKENVKNARNDLHSLLTTIKIKIFNDEDKDKKIIRWSKYIYSDSILTILQKIFFDKKKLTFWEKTNLLSGYYIVHYISGQHMFSVSEEFINQTLNNEISYVKDFMIQNVENIQPKFRKELDEFISDKKEQQLQLQTMAIIYCQYPYQTEMKISFFGLKNQVDIAKRQIKLLINKHRMRQIWIGLDSTQREFLLDNYVHEIKNLEIDYKDDNIKIKIRENIIIAPQYLIIKIKQLIQSKIFQTITLIFRYIKNAFILTEKDHLKLTTLAQNYHCEINKIDTATKKELIILPKGKNTTTSKYIMNQSNQFYSSLSIWKKLSISNNTIEIHTSYDSTVDITIISTIGDAIKEKIDPKYGNGYFESDTNKRILFIEWSPYLSQENNNNKINESIKKFISTSIKQIDILCANIVKTIAFTTTDWKNYDNKKQLAENFLNEMINQLESKQYSDRSWKILFLFNDEQSDLYNEFLQIILRLQIDRDDYEQFFYPISTTSITLKASGNSNISKCEKSINDYMKKNVLTTIELNHPFNPEIWNQHMINTYYKYCLENCVLPKIYQINKQTTQQQCLNLIGSISSVNQVKQKYELMSEIERQKLLVCTQILESDEVLSTSSTQILNNTSDSFNILLNCCSNDKILLRHLANRLIDEGYLVTIDYSDQTHSNIGSKFDKTDLIVICFSFNYSENATCMIALNTIKSSGKKYIPIMLTKTSLKHEDDWFQIVHTKELYYESFQEEIKFKLNGNLALDYDKFLIELLHYTKPGAVDRTNPMSDTTINKEEQEEDNIDQSNMFSHFTQEEIREKEQIYEKQIEQILEKDKISEDELTDLINSLKNVIEDYENAKDSILVEEQKSEESIQGIEQVEVKEGEEEEQVHQNEDKNNQQNEKQEAQLSQNEENYQNKYKREPIITLDYLSAVVSSAQRWLEKASNGPVIKGNLPPFTLTGDFNDAIFRMPLENKASWWVANASQNDSDHSSSDLYSNDSDHSSYDLYSNDSDLIVGPWFNNDEAHNYFQRLVSKGFQDDRDKKKEHSKKDEKEQVDADSTNTNAVRHPRFNTDLQKGTVAWDITKDRELRREYERRCSGKQLKKLKQSSDVWQRFLDQSVQLIEDIEKGKIKRTSNDIQGKIGTELKTKKEIKELNALDDPNNEIWTKKRYPSWRQEFIQIKLSNTIKWQEFCAAQAKKQS